MGPSGEWSYIRCLACGTVQLDPIPADDELNELYATHFAEQGAMRSPADIKDARVRQRTYSLQLVAKHCPPGPVLEVGPGHGFLMDEMAASGRVVRGLEASRRFVQTLQVRGHNVAQGFVNDLPGVYENLSGVFLSNVLEHLNDPEDGLRRMADTLAPGGRLVMVQPTAYLGPLLARIYRTFKRSADVPAFGQWLASPYHIFLVSPPGMRQLCARVGLELLAVKPAPTEARSGVLHLAGLGLEWTNRIGTTMSERWPLVPSHYFVVGRAGDSP